MITRRSLLQNATLLCFVNGCTPRGALRLFGSSSMQSCSPIDRFPVLGDRRLTGDDFTVPHELLWNKDGFLAGRSPVSSEKAPLVIVGGGVSGLLSGYYLRDLHPIILEQASRFGGNAKGESWGTLPYALGAAYFTEPSPGTPHSRLYEELGLSREWTIKTEEDTVEYRGVLNPRFWETRTTPADRHLYRYFLDVLNEQGHKYPEIPVVDSSLREGIDTLDRVSFLEHIIARAGGRPSLEAITAIEQYCWSSFGGSAREISAASGLNFYAGEFGPIIVMPGGNARVAERLLEEITTVVPPRNLRPRSLVIGINRSDAGVIVQYVDDRRELREIVAQAVICACPKFVVSRILTNIEPTRAAAIKRLSYRAYLVANVLLHASASSRFYDTYLLGNGHTEGLATQQQALQTGATDVILANYASHGGAGANERAVLTLYQALPYDGGRGWLFGQSTDHLISHFAAQITERVLPLLGISPSAIADIRVTRWGHPLPLAATNLIADRVTDTIRAPFHDRVFFIEQDNWALPALETCVAEAAAITPAVRRMLG